MLASSGGSGRAGDPRHFRRLSTSLDITHDSGDAAGMRYPGGKNGAGIYQTIINCFPPHETYIEPFLGGGAILRLKRPAALNIGLDLDPAAVAALLDRRRFDLGWAAGEFDLRVGDGIEFLRQYPFSGNELVYCDPPYLHSTRASTKAVYRFEMSDEQHNELLNVLLSLPCAVAVSGYWSGLYGRRLAKWQQITFQAMTRGGARTEHLWFNYARPAALHDYSYAGADFRQRERIKRKRLRWVRRLERMPELERHVLLSAIAECWPASPLPALLPAASPLPASGSLSTFFTAEEVEAMAFARREDARKLAAEESKWGKR